MNEFFTKSEIELHVGLQFVKRFYSVFESCQRKTGQLLSLEVSVDNLSFLFCENICSQSASVLLREWKVLSTFYPYNRDAEYCVLQRSKNSAKNKGSKTNEDDT